MDRIGRYMDVVPLPVIMLAPVIAIFGFFVIPKQFRFDFSLAFMVVWLIINRLIDLGFLYAIAKVTVFAAFIAVAFSAYMDPRPKRKLAGMTWLYPVLAVYSSVFILTVVDRNIGLALRVQWLLLVVAAMMTARTMVDGRSCDRVVRALCIGLGAALIVVFASLPLQRGGAFASGLRRFEPWGANSNQVAVLYSLSFPLFLYMGLKGGRGVGSGIWKPIQFGFAALALGMVLISQSRSAMGTMMIASVPLFFVLAKKPVFLVMGSVVGAGFVALVLRQAQGEASLDRFSSLETGRGEIFMHYLNNEIRHRPIVGLLGTKDMSFTRAMGEEMHAHNAYLDLAFVGGIALLLPMFFVLSISVISIVTLFKHRRALGSNQLVVSVFMAILVSMYIQGLVNAVIYYPTYEFAFAHVLFSVLALTWARDIRNGVVPLANSGYDTDTHMWDAGEDEAWVGYEQPVESVA